MERLEREGVNCELVAAVLRVKEPKKTDARIA
jgi:hypothetical protein